MLNRMALISVVLIALDWLAQPGELVSWLSRMRLLHLMRRMRQWLRNGRRRGLHLSNRAKDDHGAHFGDRNADGLLH